MYVCIHVVSILTIFFNRASLIICDPPWESREKGERTGTRAMTRHAKRIAYPSDMHICNQKTKTVMVDIVSS